MAEGYIQIQLFERTKNVQSVSVPKTGTSPYNIQVTKSGYRPLLANIYVGDWGDYCALNVTNAYADGSFTSSGYVHNFNTVDAVTAEVTVEVIWTKN